MQEADFQSPATTPVVAAKKPNVKEAKQTEPKKDESPKPKYTKAELDGIFDQILFEGTYSEQMKLRGGKLVVTYRSRTAGEVEEISNLIDGTEANLIATLSDKRALANLKYALVSYQGKKLDAVPVEQRVEFISSLPGVVVALLVQGMNAFDEKVYEACKDAEVNF